MCNSSLVSGESCFAMAICLRATAIPISSCISRVAASSGVSPGLIFPPTAQHQTPGKGCFVAARLHKRSFPFSDGMMSATLWGNVRCFNSDLGRILRTFPFQSISSMSSSVMVIGGVFCSKKI